jgi:hypothetical protein
MTLDVLFGHSASDSLGNVRYRSGCCFTSKPSLWISVPATVGYRKSDSDKIDLLRLIQEGEREVSLLCFDEVDEVLFGVVDEVAVVPVLCLGRLKMEG